MSHPAMSQTPPPERPLAKWARMGKYVHILLRSHPVLEPIRSTGQAVVCHSYERVIYATCLRDPYGNDWLIKKMIERPEWWVPAKRSHGDRIAAELAGRVLDRWRGRREGRKGG